MPGHTTNGVGMEEGKVGIANRTTSETWCIFYGLDKVWLFPVQLSGKRWLVRNSCWTISACYGRSSLRPAIRDELWLMLTSLLFPFVTSRCTDASIWIWQRSMSYQNLLLSWHPQFASMIFFITHQTNLTVAVSLWVSVDGGVFTQYPPKSFWVQIAPQITPVPCYHTTLLISPYNFMQSTLFRSCWYLQFLKWCGMEAGPPESFQVLFVRCPFREEHFVAHQKNFPLYICHLGEDVPSHPILSCPVCPLPPPMDKSGWTFGLGSCIWGSIQCLNCHLQ